MSLKQHFEYELNRLAARGDAAGGIEIATAQGQLNCEIVSIEKLACAFKFLGYESSKLAGISVQQLRQLGDSLTNRLTYLLEPIGALEIDSEGFTLQLRSNPPQRNDDGRSYYELLARKGQVGLCRFRKVGREPRSVIASEVTREVLLRLVTDFDSAIAEA